MHADHGPDNQIPLMLECMMCTPRRRTIEAPALLCRPIRHSGCEWCCCMQGNCAGAPPSAASLGLSGAPLLPLLPYQCLLIADVQLLKTSWDTQLWLDGLYVRYRRTGRFRPDANGNHLAQPFIENWGSLWMTAITLQGDGDGISDCYCCGLRINGKLYAEGVLLVCHNARCSSCAPIVAPQRLLAPHRACAIQCAPHCEGVALPHTACSTHLCRSLKPLERLSCRLHICPL
jgi:hypothetical protein